MKHLALIALLLLGGCAMGEAAYERRLEEWVGQPEEEVLYKWGPPIAAYDNGHLKTLTFRWQNQYRGTQFYCDTTFYIEAGYVVSWAWSGNACRA